MKMTFLHPRWLLVLAGPLCLVILLCLTMSPAAIAAEDGRTVNVYSWVDYFPKDVRERFQRDTGIKVNYTVFDNPDAVETVLSVGHSGYDVVIVNASPHLAREAPRGFFTPLDKARLPNIRHADAQLMKVLQGADPGNRYAVPWMWGTTGVMYDRARLQSLIRTPPANPLDLILRKDLGARFAKCGVSVLDSWVDVLPMVARYLGQKDLSAEPAALEPVVAALMAIRPNLRLIASSGYFEQLANGDLCLALGYSGDAMIAQRMVRETGLQRSIDYAFPVEAVPLYIDSMTIPAGAPHAAAAHTFIDYMMQPPVSANVVGQIGFGAGNADAVPLLPTTMRNNPAVFPPAEVRAKFYLGRLYTPEETRTFTRAWQRFKTGT
ncbi:MAG: extracellular solute-binding protein [Steroidobacteraceae bacterium]